VKAGLKFTVTKTLPVRLPKTLPAIFNNCQDQLIRYTNDKFKHTYRLVCFSIGSDTFYILTNRRFLTTFQVIILYASRWQIELLFRFLKRTMNGLHLIKQDQHGVTIQFYALLIAAMLELRLKQKSADQNQAKDNKHSEDKRKATDVSKKAERGSNAAMTDVPKRTKKGAFDDFRKAISLKKGGVTSSGRHSESESDKLNVYGYKFIESIGKNLHKYWKIGIHWLTTLQRLLAKPFNEGAIEIFNSS